MVEIFRCARAEVYHNSGKKTLTQVKKETGCTHIINGYLFNSSFRPLGWTVIDGKSSSGTPTGIGASASARTEDP